MAGVDSADLKMCRICGMKDNKYLNSAVFMIVLIDYKIVHSTIAGESGPETICHTMSDEQQTQSGSHCNLRNTAVIQRL